MLSNDIWINEGHDIAKNLIESFRSPNNIFKPIDILNWYRDIFALFSFEAFPGDYLIDIFHNFGQRVASDYFKQYMLVSTWNYGFANVNTYKHLSFSSKYSLLFAQINWALSMNNREYNVSVSDIVKLHRHNDNDKKGLIPCKICGTPFKPRKRDQKTCGKLKCINANKALTKKHNKYLQPPVIPS